MHLLFLIAKKECIVKQTIYFTFLLLTGKKVVPKIIITKNSQDFSAAAHGQKN